MRMIFITLLFAGVAFAKPLPVPTAQDRGSLTLVVASLEFAPHGTVVSRSKRPDGAEYWTTGFYGKKPYNNQKISRRRFDFLYASFSDIYKDIRQGDEQLAHCIRPIVVSVEKNESPVFTENFCYEMLSADAKKNLDNWTFAANKIRKEF